MDVLEGKGISIAPQGSPHFNVVMSSLTSAQHKQLLGAILGYLKDIQAHAPAGAVADTLELNNAIRSLGAASGLASQAELNAFSIQPHTLTSLFSAASIPAPVRTHLLSSPLFPTVSP